MSGKTKAQKEQERLGKIAVEKGISVDEVKAQEKVVADKKAEEKKKVAEKAAEDKAVADKKAKEVEQEGFIQEISEKIELAKDVDDLTALNQRVYDIWGDNVPVEIQELAGKRGQEIEDGKKPKVEVSLKDTQQKGWVKVTMEDVKKAEKDGKLAGFDESNMTALIND